MQIRISAVLVSAVALFAAGCGGQTAAHPAATVSPEQVVASAIQLSKPQPQLAAAFGGESGGWQATAEGTVSPGWQEAKKGDLKSRLMTASRIPMRADGAWEAYLGQGTATGVKLVPENAAPSALELRDGRAVYREVAPSTDEIFVASETSSELAFLLRAASAKASFSWKVELGAGISKVIAKSGGLEFVDAHGKSKLQMPRAFAVDAAGQKRDAQLAWDEKTSRITLALDTEGMKFPVMLDPVIATVLWEDSSPAPAPRAGHAMATLGSTVVLFGG